MATATVERIQGSVTLKGSAQLVTEFFDFGINNILYQRGVYPADSFQREKAYGLSLWKSTDKHVREFMTPLLKQIQEWLEKRAIKRLVLVISSIATREVLERWQFRIDSEENDDIGAKENTAPAAGKGAKDEKKIRAEISDVMRQITASVTFLPLLEEPCSFDVLIYKRVRTRTGSEERQQLPSGWSESDECLVKNAQRVQLRQFSTGHHSVSSEVAYRAETE